MAAATGKVPCTGPSTRDRPELSHRPSAGRSELVRDQGADGVDALLSPVTRRGHLDDGPTRSAKEQDFHDALPVRGLLVARHLDVAWEPTRELDELRRRS